MGKRNDYYKQEAPKLAHQAATEALKRWGRAHEEITHIIYVSCTGAVAPGVELLLAQQLGLQPNVRRLGINFMGCFGAFAGLATARAFAASEPEARILVICTELCSLHYQPSERMDQLVANSLFADGAAAVVVGNSLRQNEKPLFEMQTACSFAVPNSLDKMSWEASDTGFVMGLSPDVPRYLRAHIKKYRFC
jgi:predicted naringenin-chalcone synthase